MSADLLSARTPKTQGILTGGMGYRLPAQQALPIFNAPRGVLITLVPPQADNLTVSLLAIDHSWARIRLGHGPVLEGFTNARLG